MSDAEITVTLTSDAVARGESDSMYAAHRRGESTRVRPGAFAPTDQWQNLSKHDRQLARIRTYARQNPDALLVGESAALIHGLPVVEKMNPRVQILSTRSGGSRSRNDVQERRFAIEPVAQIIGGIHVASLVDVLADVSRGRSFRRGVVALDHALHGALIAGDDPEELRLAVDDCRRRAGGGRGTRSAKGVIEFASASAQSPLESISRVAVFEAGLPAPELQHEWILPGGGRAYSDFYWPRFGIIGEADGDAKYSIGADDASEAVLASMKHEKSRDQELRLLGASVIHWGWNDAWHAAPLISLLTRAGLHP